MTIEKKGHDQIGYKRINSLDKAIKTCDEHIEHHKQAAARLLSLLVQVGLIILSVLFLFIMLSLIPVDATGASVTPASSIAIIFSLLATFIIVFVVLMVTYGSHLTEISKAKHYKIGLMRVGIAAYNYTKGFRNEVQAALTDNAFNFEPTAGLMRRLNKIENSSAGRSITDITASILKKFLEVFDFTTEKKKGKQRAESD
jgi:hypothetical protein